MAKTDERTQDDGARAPAPSSDICPACGHGHLHRSHRRGFSEYVRSWTGYYPYRCKECKARCFKKRGGDAPSRPDKRPEQKQRARRRAMREILIYSTAVLIFLAFLYYVTRMPVDTGP